MRIVGACMIVGGMFIIGHAIGAKDKEGKLPGQALKQVETFVRSLKLEEAFTGKEAVAAPIKPTSPLPIVTAGFPLTGLLSRLSLPGSMLPSSNQPRRVGWRNGEGEDLGGYYRRPYRQWYGNGYHNGNGHRRYYGNGYNGNGHNGYYNGNGNGHNGYVPYYDPYAKYRAREGLRDLIDIDDDDDGEFNLDLRIRAR